jgi:hypothetical protein
MLMGYGGYSPSIGGMLWVMIMEFPQLFQGLRRLQGELSPGRTQTYLEAARPYARDWLRDRVGKTLVRMLRGILDREMAVVFECEA